MTQSHAGPDGRDLLLLIGSSSRRGREFILRSVTARYQLWLMQPADVSWERAYVVGSTVVDNTDPVQLVTAARKVAEQYRVTGVFCFDEGLVWPAAHVSQALGLPGNTPETIAACRDKHATREAMARVNVDQPASIGVSSWAEAAAASDKIGYPVVVKPRGLAGSMGVKRADSAADLPAAFTAACDISYPGVPVFDMNVLIEEYVSGPEISIDAVFFDGRCVPLAVARKQVAFDPFFEEVGHLVDGADPLLSDAVLLDTLKRSHAALGFRTGVTHTEFRLTPRGPRLLEINARLGGDMIPYLGHLATGVDIAMAAADVAAGRCPDTTVRWRKAAAITFLYPEEDIEVESVTVHEESFGADVHSALALVDPGAVLRLPPRGYISRFGRVIAVADSIDLAQAALANARDIVRLTTHPAEVLA